ncbi:MAG: SUMF1/EgtB/PvdO family nonheme iron enzyme [Kiritimatiellaeota bacterium]|nr:SUMF1/EgtB/PvdO family nonheme iron enzyme [Kiritimatiellota bacterium]
MKKWLCVNVVAAVSLLCGAGRAMAQDVAHPYMIVTLPASLGGSYSVDYADAIPGGGWTDEHKTEKLVLTRVYRDNAAIMNDYYVGVFETTVGQFSRVMGQFGNPAALTNKTAFIFAAPNGDPTKGHDFFNYLNTGVQTAEPAITNNFWYPTAAQWEYAYLADTETGTGYFFEPPASLGDFAWYNADGVSAPQEVGLKAPNPWGLYDIAGNVAEAVGDGLSVARGGSYLSAAGECKATSPSLLDNPGDLALSGFRACFEVPTTYYTLAVTSGTGGGGYTNGQVVAIAADAPAAGWQFDRWTGDTATVADITLASTTLIMPGSNITVEATYMRYPTLTVDNGSGGGEWATGTEVSISALAPPQHHTFAWDGTVAVLALVDDVTSWNTFITMPAFDITLTATYPLILYPLTVESGTGGGSYTNGHIAEIAAASPPSALHEFVQWVGDTAGIEDIYSPSTTLTIDEGATVRASYRPKAMLANNYMVVSLTGSNADPTYLDEAPMGGWNTTTYKNDKLVLKKMMPDTFTMGSAAAGTDAAPHTATLTKVFYMGLFPVTQVQWYYVAGNWPSAYQDIAFRDLRPVENVSYADIRGDTSGAEWPSRDGVDSGSFMARLRAKANNKAAFDLPTEAQWEYVCRAGTTTAYSFGDNTNALALHGWYSVNAAILGEPPMRTQPVGMLLPNPWGFYDMHGNVNEWCLDWYTSNFYTSNAAKNDDPAGPPSSGNRVRRGGSYLSSAAGAQSAYRGFEAPTNSAANTGLRVAWTAGIEYPLTVDNAIVNTNGAFLANAQIPITAEDRRPEWRFLRWDVSPAGASLGTAFNANNESTVVTMPAGGVTLTAVYQVSDGYTALTIVDGVEGIGDGVYETTSIHTNGDVVAVTADTPLYYEFICWTGDTDDLLDPDADATSFTADGGEITLTATYKILDVLPPNVHLLTTVGNGTTLTIPVEEGETSTVTASPPPAGLVFGWWDIDPAGTPLGAGFNENGATTDIVMPTTDLTLTAVYVRDPGTDTPGYADIRLVDSVTLAPLAGAQWSLDGKEFFDPAGKYPLKPGTYTVRFRPPSTNWLTPANARLVIRAGETVTLTVPFTWVPVVTGVVALPVADSRDTVTLSPANGQVLPGKTVKLTAKPASTSVFVEWTDGEMAAVRQEAPAVNTTYEAVFRLKSSYTLPPVVSPGAPGASVPTVGVLYSHVVGINERPATFKAKGLPPGLKINSATGEISGIPTKAGTFPVTVTATNPNKLSHALQMDITIADLSPYAQGAFTGYLTNATAEVVGTFTMKASAKGALSVKVAVQDAAVSFSTKGWQETDGIAYTAAFLTKKGEALSLTVDTSTWTVSGLAANGKVGPVALDLTGQWDLFKVNKKAADYPLALATLAKYQGYYTVALPTAACAMLTAGLDNVQEGAGYLTLTVSKTGGVKVAGALPDGTKLSASTTLMVSPGGDALVPVFAPLYSKRGVASGLLPIQTGATMPGGNRILPGAQWQWVYPGRSAAATLDGFGATLDPFGAFYAKVASIEAYYGSASLTTDVDTVSMDVPLVFSAKGAASLSTEATENPYQAKITVKPATGLFNGTFKRDVAGKATTVKYLGVLTQTPADDHVGYGAYVLPQTERAGSTSYSLKPSYPVIIE